MSLDRYWKGVISDDYFQEIAKRNLDGHYSIRKFFDNPYQNTGTVETWDYADVQGSYAYTANAGADYYLCSNNAGNTQVIEIALLDENFEMKTLYVTLTGQTPVKVNDVINNTVVFGTAVDFKCTRVYRMINRGTTNIAGIVYCVEGNDITAGVPNDTTDVRAVIRGTNNQTLMCQYTIPGNFYGIFIQGALAITNKQTAAVDASFLVRASGTVFAVQDRLGLNTSGSNVNRTRIIGDLIPPRADITLKASASTACGLSGNYTILLVKPDYIDRLNIESIL